jgi:hypothetical protein
MCRFLGVNTAITITSEAVLRKIEKDQKTFFGFPQVFGLNPRTDFPIWASHNASARQVGSSRKAIRWCFC